MGFRRKGSNASDQEKRYQVDFGEIALHLFVNVREELIKLAGYELRDTGNEYAYGFLLQAGAAYTVKDCNDFLRKMKLKPLTSL